MHVRGAAHRNSCGEKEVDGVAKQAVELFSDVTGHSLVSA
jgi:hypothetical protein